MQVGRQPRGGVARQVVVPVRVLPDAAGEPAPHPGPALALAACRQPRRDLPGHQGAARRQRVGRHVGHRDPARRRDHLARCGGPPAAEVRGEHREVVPGRRTGRHHRARRQHGHHRVVHPQRAPDALQGRPQPLLAPCRVAAGAARHVHRRGAGLLGDPAGLRDHVAVPDDQPSAPGPQARRRGRPGSRRGTPPGWAPAKPAGRQALVQHEQRHHPFRLGERRPQHRVVVHPQVGGEQHDRGPRRLLRPPSAHRRPSGGAAGVSVGVAAERALRVMLRAMPPKTTPWNGRDAPPVRVAEQPVRLEQRALPVDACAPAVLVGDGQLQPGEARQPHLGAQPQQPARARSPRPARSPASRRPAAGRGSRRPRRSPTPPTSRSSQPRTAQASGKEYQPFSPPMPSIDPPQRGRRRRPPRAARRSVVEAAAGPVGVGGQRVAGRAGHRGRRPAGGHVGVPDPLQREPHRVRRSRAGRSGGSGT